MADTFRWSAEHTEILRMDPGNALNMAAADEIERLTKRLAGTTIKACLTRDAYSQNALPGTAYCVWFGTKPVNCGYVWEGDGPGTTGHKMVDESAIPEHLRLEPGGGPLAVELAILGAKEADHEGVDGI